MNALRAVFRKTGGLALLLLAGSPVESRAQAGEVHIDIAYRYAIDRLSPHPKSNIQIRRGAYLVLYGNGQVRYFEGRTRRVGGRVRSFGKQGQGNLGELSDGLGGWQVTGPKTLRGILKWGNSVNIITVQVTSDTSCSASSRLLKAEGAEVVRMNMSSRPGTIGSFANFRPISVNCIIFKQEG